MKRKILLPVTGWLLFAILTPDWPEGYRSGIMTVVAVFIFTVASALVLYGTWYFILPFKEKPGKALLVIPLLVLFWIIFAAVCYGMLLVDIADALSFALKGKGFLVPVTRYYLGLSLTGFLTWQITREQRKRVTDKEIYEADIAFIKAQINPHFLFNTLGLFFNQTERPMPKVAQGIEALSNLMRYSIQKANADGYVYLYEEKKFIKELLSIYQLRFNNKLCFDLAISGNISGKRVTPHVIHAIVENAFDMGEFINPMHPIRVKMDISADTLHFSLTYKINSGYRGAGYHVEPLYIRRRLNQAYPGKNTYTVKEENGFHTSQLIIPL